MLKQLNNKLKINPIYFSTKLSDNKFNVQNWSRYLDDIQTSKLSFIEEHERIKMFRVIDQKGNYLPDTNYKNKISNELLLDCYNKMLLLTVYDRQMLKIQRQGRISFYMAGAGEEASSVCSTAGLNPKDWIFPQYRQQGIFIQRGYPIEQMINQCIGNLNDPAKGRQLPVHYAAKEQYIMDVSSCLGTRIPHASGSGQAQKIKGDDNITVAQMGEGTCSEGDAYTGIHFAAVLKSHTMFIITNNAQAISMPADQSYAGDGIASKSAAMGVTSCRVDGSDALAIINAVREARELIIKQQRPALVELMLYRISNHSTSDSPTQRNNDDVDWLSNNRHGNNRLRLFLENNKVINNDQTDEMILKQEDQFKFALDKCSKLKLWHPKVLFEDMYEEMPLNLIEQKEELMTHLEKYKNNQDTNKQNI